MTTQREETASRSGGPGAPGAGSPMGLTGSSIVPPGEHWPAITFSSNLLADALIKHVLGLIAYGMSDLGEVLEIVAGMGDDGEEAWLSAWSERADLLQRRAEAAEEAGHPLSAASSYARSATYRRVGLMRFSHPEDPRLREQALTSSACYERYLELSAYPGRYVEVPYEDTVLPGHFYRSPHAGETAPLLILTPGRDTWAEDTCWVYEGALRRGIHCLVYDGPGQGYALRLQDLRFRPDWENVLTPVVDFALTLPEVDPDRIGVMGLSFGGLLAPRGAAFDKRIKACVSDPGCLDWNAIAAHLEPIAQLPPGQLPEGVRDLVRDYAWKQGVPDTIADVVADLRAYDLRQVAGQITCPTLVVDGTAEPSHGQARLLFDALSCPKDYLLFDETSTAQAHTQIGAYATATEAILDWLADQLIGQSMMNGDHT